MAGKQNRFKALKLLLLAILTFILVAFLEVFLSVTFRIPLLQCIGTILFGWLLHLFRVGPQLVWNIELILCFLVALSLGTWMLHRGLNWLHQQGSIKLDWTPKCTLALTSLLLMLFGMSVAMTGIVHQSIWVIKGPISQSNNRATHLTSTINDAKELYMLCYFHASDHDGHYPSKLNLLLDSDDNIELSPNDLYYQPKNKELPPEP